MCPNYGTRSVAQHVFALLLELTQNVGYHARTVRGGKWHKSLDFCYWDRPLVELAGSNLGIVGYGQIGRAVAEIGLGFNTKILVSSLSEKQGVTQVSIEELLPVK